MPPLLVRLALASFILAMPAASLAFDSYPTGPGIDSVHDKVVNAATESMGISDELDELQEAVRRPDWEETKLTPGPGFLKPNAHYRADHHFDRPPSISHAQAFAAGSTYFREQFDKAVLKAAAGSQGAALDAIGRSLHAVQDFVSHSNLIDLPPAEAGLVVNEVIAGTASGVTTLRLTGYDPAASEPGKPAGDDFAHDDFSKDRSDRNSESTILVGGVTKFSLAKAKGVELTARVLREFKNKLTESQWEDFLDEAD
jgi:hypothetical protein